MDLLLAKCSQRFISSASMESPLSVIVSYLSQFYHFSIRQSKGFWLSFRFGVWTFIHSICLGWAARREAPVRKSHQTHQDLLQSRRYGKWPPSLYRWGQNVLPRRKDLMGIVHLLFFFLDPGPEIRNKRNMQRHVRSKPLAGTLQVNLTRVGSTGKSWILWVTSKRLVLARKIAWHLM
jgi:hypothetical protein